MGKIQQKLQVFVSDKIDDIENSMQNKTNMTNPVLQSAITVQETANLSNENILFNLMNADSNTQDYIYFIIDYKV